MDDGWNRAGDRLRADIEKDNALNENARKWVEALRSGEFEQGQGALMTDRGHYCCLGVACEVYRRETGEGEWDARAGGTFDGSAGVPPDVVRKWLGLVTNDGFYRDSNGRAMALTLANDCGDPFERIADIIESRPEGLFA